MNTRNPEKPALISLVVPLYNNEEHVRMMYSELYRVFEDINKTRTVPYDFEIIYVNDGSRDRSWDIIEEVASEDKAVRGLCLSRNFGKMAALEAGFKAAHGDAVITMDGDLEDPPEYISQMLKKWEEGHEIVRMKRIYQKDRSLFKRFMSDAFYMVMNIICDTQMVSGMSDFGLIDRQVADTLHHFGEREMFYRAMLGWVGFKSVVIEYTKGECDLKETTFTFRANVALAWNALSAFSTLPLRFIMMLGGTITVISGLLMVIMATLRWVTETVIFADIAFLTVFIIFSNGMILSAIGVVALYLMQIHREVLERPSFIVWKRVNE